MNRQPLKWLILFIAIFALASCATQPRPEAAAASPGFFMGFWHGLIILPSFIASLFTDCRIYAFPNSGSWYDFGFLLGAGSALSGSGAAASRSTS